MGLIRTLRELFGWAFDAVGALLRWIYANIYWRRVKAIWRIGKSTVYRYWADDGDALAGYVAYATFLAMFPFAIFATALIGTFLTPENMESYVDGLFELAPTHIAQTLQPVIESVAIENARTLVTTSALFALYVASNAVEALRVAFDRAYKVPTPRHFALRRLRAFAFVIFASLTFLLLGALIVAAPLAIQIAERQIGFAPPYGTGILRYAIGLAVFALMMLQMHLFLPSKRPPRRRLMPGVWVTVVLFGIGAWAFSLYLSLTPSFSITYGALAGVIVTLLFFYLTGAAIILGAETNSVLLSFRPARRADRA